MNPVRVREDDDEDEHDDDRGGVEDGRVDRAGGDVEQGQGQGTRLGSIGGISLQQLPLGVHELEVSDSGDDEPSERGNAVDEGKEEGEREEDATDDAPLLSPRV